MVKRLLITMALLTTGVGSTLAQSNPAFDPWEYEDNYGDFSYRSYQLPDAADADKTPERLVAEASSLLREGRPLDARAKLITAIRKDPSNIEAHILLAQYYLGTVNHFRLALRYILKAQELFEQKHGKAPYRGMSQRLTHSILLSLQADTRLNLDEYEAALTILDEFQRRGYVDESYYGSRAWVLMKMGRINEAITLAEQGYRRATSSAAITRHLNMLGILYSMVGRREDSIAIFNKAIELELNLGGMGQAATPLNNVGEVYRETFREDDAARAFSRALRLPDGCEHVLPALNSAFLALERLEPSSAEQALREFSECLKQYPLRNNEEHKALVDLAQGRIALLQGDPETAVKLLDDALNKTQWFGKIGTHEDDFKLAAQATYADALEALANLQTSIPDIGFTDWIQAKISSAALRTQAWWVRKQALARAIKRGNDFEDIYVRHSDSLILYSTIGSLLRTIPSPALRRRLATESAADERAGAKTHYSAYLAENLLAAGKTEEGTQLAYQVLTKARPRDDALLQAHLNAILLTYGELATSEYDARAVQLFLQWRPILRLYGLTLPVGCDAANESSLRAAFAGSPLRISSNAKSPFTLRLEPRMSGVGFSFSSKTGTPGTIRVSSESRREAAKKLIDELFKQR